MVVALQHYSLIHVELVLNTVLLEQLLGNKIKLSSQYFKFIMMSNSFKVNKVKAIAHKVGELEPYIFP